MSEVLCQVEDCDRPVDDAWVCMQCKRRLERALGDVPARAYELNVTLARLRTNFSNGETGRSRETALPMNGDASEAYWLLRNTLSTWVRLVAEERGHPMPADTLAAMARWLLSETEWLRHQQFGHEAVEEIRFAVWQAGRIVDIRAERIYAGPCTECGGDLYAKPGAVNAECRPCGVEYPVAEMQEWMKSQVYGRLVTAREGAALLSRFGLETKQATIDTWVQRKRLVSHAPNADGHRMYLFDDLVALAAKAQKLDTPMDRVAS